MTSISKLTPRLLAVLLAAAVALAVVAVVRLAIGSGPGQRHLSADFSSTVSLYKGAKVQLLGVDIGSVDSVTVVGTHVRVELSYDDTNRLPSDVHAVIAAPSVVGDRVIELGPAYTSGPVLADHATVPLSRTAVPLELDETFRETDRLTKALGPSGANKDGALSTLLTTLQSNLKGNGAQINSTVKRLAAALNTVSGVRGDVAGTITSLSKITGTLAARDPQVRLLMDNLASVSSQLSDQRTSLATATRSLDSALKQVTGFIRQNRTSLSKNITSLTRVTRTLAKHKAGLEEIVNIAPLAVTNLLESGLPENFKLSNPDAVPPALRLGSVPVRADLFNGLDRQLGLILGSVCGKIPDPSKTKLGGLCTALQQAGNNLGDVLDNLLGSGALSGALPTSSLGGLLGGGA